MSLLRLNIVTELPASVQANNVIYVELPEYESLDIALVVDFVEEWLTYLFADWLPAMSDAVTIIKALIYLVDVIDGTGLFVGEANLTLDGQSAGLPLPHGVAAKLDAKVDGRPRPAAMYLCGMSVAVLSASGLFTASTITRMLDTGDNWNSPYTDVNSVQGIPMYWSQKDLQAFSLVGASITANDVPDYQRRRKPGVGT